MTDSDRIVESLARLPATPCTSIRGCPEGASFVRPGQVTVATGLVPTSRSLDTASDGGRSPADAEQAHVGDGVAWVAVPTSSSTTRCSAAPRQPHGPQDLGDTIR